MSASSVSGHLEIFQNFPTPFLYQIEAVFLPPNCTHRCTARYLPKNNSFRTRKKCEIKQFETYCQQYCICRTYSKVLIYLYRLTNVWPCRLTYLNCWNPLKYKLINNKKFFVVRVKLTIKQRVQLICFVDQPLEFLMFEKHKLRLTSHFFLNHWN